jgi:hypothetical protein
MSTTVLFLIADVSLCEESPQVGASHPHNIDHNKTTRVREGIETHASARVVATLRTQVKNRAHKHSTASSQLNKCSNLKHNESDACLQSLGVLGCSMEAWCTAPCTRQRDDLPSVGHSAKKNTRQRGCLLSVKHSPK